MITYQARAAWGKKLDRLMTSLNPSQYGCANEPQMNASMRSYQPQHRSGSTVSSRPMGRRLGTFKTWNLEAFYTRNRPIQMATTKSGSEYFSGHGKGMSSKSRFMRYLCLGVYILPLPDEAGSITKPAGMRLRSMNIYTTIMYPRSTVVVRLHPNGRPTTRIAGPYTP